MVFFQKKHPPNPRLILIAFPLLIVIALGVKLWQQYHWPTTTMSLKGQTLHLLVADTTARQYRGLGNRDSIDGYDGMLFVFPESNRYGFVMRDMRFPLDIVWFHNGTVVDIAPNTQIQPKATEAGFVTFFPRDVANAAIEFRAGWAAIHGLKIGDELLRL